MATFHLQNDLGTWGEDCAVDYLRSEQYTIIARNWYNPQGKRQGEIDIIAHADGLIVFVEVKALHAGRHEESLPELQITRAKLLKLRHVCMTYIRMHKLHHMPWRIDAIAIVKKENDAHNLRHIPYIFF